MTQRREYFIYGLQIGSAGGICLYTLVLWITGACFK